jgi:hypothetical protein
MYGHNTLREETEMRQLFDFNHLPVITMDVTGAARFGLQTLFHSLQVAGSTVSEIHHWTDPSVHESPVLMIGTTRDRRIALLLESASLTAGPEPESTIIQWGRTRDGIPVLVLAGTDETGLMYTLLEMAERIDSQGLEALNEAEDQYETPDNRVRCVDRYVVGHLDDAWLKSETFWRYYLPRLARARFNRFCLIVGFDTAYMAPPYPISSKCPDTNKSRWRGRIRMRDRPTSTRCASSAASVTNTACWLLLPPGSSAR